MISISKILSLTQTLYPTGRAFRKTGTSKLHKGLAISETQAYNDMLSMFNVILPDNENFTDQDATDWECRLGLITSSGVSLQDRKQAITRKYNHPGNIKPRQHYLYMQRELRSSGFDVYVHPNRFDDGLGGVETRDPIVVTGQSGAIAEHGDIQHADAQHGGGYNHIIANSLDRAVDERFSVGNNLKFTFFIGGQNVGDSANVDGNREKEFRQLVLKIKPLHTVGYLIINYI